MSETDISTAAVDAHAKRLRDHGHSGTHGILPVTLALLADRDRLQRENDNLRQIERNVQAVREQEHQRANAAEADRDRLAAEVARLRWALEFYGDKTAWSQPPVKTHEGILGIEYENAASKVQKDRGKMARAVLAARREGEA